MFYDSGLNNQHHLTRKFVRQWFSLYVVTSASDNALYHLAELDGTRIAIAVVGKRIKSFKKQHKDEPDPESVDDGDDRIGADGDSESES